MFLSFFQKGNLMENKISGQFKGPGLQREEFLYPVTLVTFSSISRAIHIILKSAQISSI